MTRIGIFFVNISTHWHRSGDTWRMTGEWPTIWSESSPTQTARVIAPSADRLWIGWTRCFPCQCPICERSRIRAHSRASLRKEWKSWWTIWFRRRTSTFTGSEWTRTKTGSSRSASRQTWGPLLTSCRTHLPRLLTSLSNVSQSCFWWGCEVPNFIRRSNFELITWTTVQKS